MARSFDQLPDNESLHTPEYWEQAIESCAQYWKSETSSHFSERRFLPPNPLLFASENPENPRDGLVGFSYEVQVQNDEGESTPFAFNFFLPADNARLFIEAVTANPALIEHIFQSQYAGLRLNRVPASKLVQLLNVEDLFPQEEPVRMKLGELNRRYIDNLRVHPLKLGSAEPASQSQIEDYFAELNHNLHVAHNQRRRES